MADLHDAGELNRLVSQSSQPVLVDFYKQGCENCAAFEKTMGRLSGEYTGRVVFAEFMLMRANGAAASPELAEKYDILFYPTAILFRSGLPVKTFVTDYDIADYRAALGQPTSRPAGR